MSMTSATPDPSTKRQFTSHASNPTCFLPKLPFMQSLFGLRISDFLRTSVFGFRILPLLLAGCAVGPNYHRPTALGTNAMPASFSGAMPTNTSIWKPAQPSAHLPRGPWWEVFGDPELNRLEASRDRQQPAARRRVRKPPAGSRPDRRCPCRVLAADLDDTRGPPPAHQRESILGSSVLQPRVHLQHLQRAARRELGTRPLGPGAPRRRKHASQPHGLRR